MQANCTLPTIELVADNSTSDSNQKEYLIDRDELLHLRESGLIQPKLFVYKRNQAELRPFGTVYRHSCFLRATGTERIRILYSFSTASESESSATSGSSVNASIVLSRVESTVQLGNNITDKQETL